MFVGLSTLRCKEIRGICGGGGLGMMSRQDVQGLGSTGGGGHWRIRFDIGGSLHVFGRLVGVKFVGLNFWHDFRVQGWVEIVDGFGLFLMLSMFLYRHSHHRGHPVEKASVETTVSPRMSIHTAVLQISSWLCNSFPSLAEPCTSDTPYPSSGRACGFNKLAALSGERLAERLKIAGP